MSRFHILSHPDGKLEAVKDGFSIAGLFFGGFWLLYHRIYALASVAMTVGLLLYAVFPSPEGYVFGVPYGHRFGLADVGNILICIVVGVLGNSWRLESLVRRGFDLVDTVEAQTADAARGCYLRARKANEPKDRQEPTLQLD